MSQSVLTLKGLPMKRNGGSGCLAVLVLALGMAAAAAEEQVSVDFEKVMDKTVFDGAGRRCARLMGAAKLSAEAKQAAAALELRGPDAKGVVDFGPSFGMSKEGTIELWCKPRALSGLLGGHRTCQAAPRGACGRGVPKSIRPGQHRFADFAVADRGDENPSRAGTARIPRVSSSASARLGPPGVEQQSLQPTRDHPPRRPVQRSGRWPRPMLQLIPLLRRKPAQRHQLTAGCDNGRAAHAQRCRRCPARGSSPFHAPRARPGEMVGPTALARMIDRSRASGAWVAQALPGRLSKRAGHAGKREVVGRGTTAP